MMTLPLIDRTGGRSPRRRAPMRASADRRRTGLILEPPPLIDRTSSRSQRRRAPLLASAAADWRASVIRRIAEQVGADLARDEKESPTC